MVRGVAFGVWLLTQEFFYSERNFLSEINLKDQFTWSMLTFILWLHHCHGEKIFLFCVFCMYFYMELYQTLNSHWQYTQDSVQWTFEQQKHTVGTGFNKGGWWVGGGINPKSNTLETISCWTTRFALSLQDHWPRKNFKMKCWDWDKHFDLCILFSEVIVVIAL